MAWHDMNPPALVTYMSSIATSASARVVDSSCQGKDGILNENSPHTTYGGRWIVVGSRDLFLYRENLSFCLESKIELNQQKREHETQQTEKLINH